MIAKEPDNSGSSPKGFGVARKPLVVVVDDEPDTVLMLLMLLREQGYDAEGFGSGKAALESLRKLDPDVIISDIVMPPPNGYDIAREVRKLKGPKRPLLIAISGIYTKDSDRILAQVAGFNFHLTKPCDIQVLMALIERARQK